MSWNIFWCWAKTFSAGDWKMHFTCPEKLCEVKEATEEKISSGTISEPEREIVGLSRKLFDMLVKVALYFSTGSFWRERFNYKVWLFLFFADFEQRKISLFAKSFGSGVKTAFYEFREAVWGNLFYFRWEKSVLLFRTLNGKIGTSCWTSSNNVDKTIHYESRKTS